MVSVNSGPIKSPEFTGLGRIKYTIASRGDESTRERLDEEKHKLEFGVAEVGGAEYPGDYR